MKMAFLIVVVSIVSGLLSIAWWLAFERFLTRDIDHKDDDGGAQ